jgi:hypothetical protein
MAKKDSPLKRAFKAARQAMEPQRYGTPGKPFVCHFCGYDRSKIGQCIEGMHTLICDGCSHIEFFVLGKMPKTIE